VFREAILKTSINRQQGSVLVEGLIAILIFSLGILSIVALLGASVKFTSTAKYRTEANLLATQIIGQMWVDDKTNTVLVSNYSSPDGAAYTAWQSTVASTLPGAGAEENVPTIAIDGNNVVTVTIKWQMPGERQNNYVTIARIRS
jgi:type IV pilus assembly protein PilV